MSNISTTEKRQTELPQRRIRPRRSVLFVPASNARAMEKAASLACDAVIFDLEDSVAPDAKGAARESLRRFLTETSFGRKEVAIRINALNGKHGTEDLLAARAAGVDAIVLPKCETTADIRQAAAALGETDAPDTMRLWAMIETAKGILQCGSIALDCADATSRLDCLIVGPNDIVKETRIQAGPGRVNLHPWLMQIVLAARAGGLDVLDGVYNDFRDTDGFVSECAQAHTLGFDGKTLIHPSQIDPANTAFSIDPEKQAEALRIVDAFAKPENAEKGVINIDGRMVERLHRDEAEALLSKTRMMEEGEGDRS